MEELKEQAWHKANADFVKYLDLDEVYSPLACHLTDEQRGELRNTYKGRNLKIHDLMEWIPGKGGNWFADFAKILKETKTGTGHEMIIEALQKSMYEVCDGQNKISREEVASEIAAIFGQGDTLDLHDNQQQQQAVPPQQQQPPQNDPMNDKPFVNHIDMTEEKLTREYGIKEKGIQEVMEDNIKKRVSGLKSYTVLIEVVNDREFMTAICQMEGEIYKCPVRDDLTKSWSSYYFGKWKNVPVIVVQTGKRVGSQFQYGSWFETKKALFYFPQIKYVFGVGVCGAAVDVDGKPRVLKGHVVVSSDIIGYDHQKKAEYDQNRSPSNSCERNNFYHFMNETANKHKWDKGLKFGQVLSGSWLIANIEAQKSLLDSYQKDQIAFEMEGVGIAVACEDTDVKACLVKGVSDYASRDKNDVWQPAAARNATCFLSDMLNKGHAN